MSKNKVATYTLNNGNKIPKIGLGVYLAPRNVTEDVVYNALKTGYRHVDSAQAYHNEEEAANGIARWINEDPENNKREDVFFTTKIFDDSHGYELTKKAIETSLIRTKSIGYIDLILMHSPQSNYEKRHGSWVALQEAVDAGTVKNIGLSNYGAHHVKEVLDYPDLKYKPVINQVEVHPWLTREDLVDFCVKNDILIEAYSPLVKGKKLDDELVVKLAEKYGKEPGQILINWSLAKGFLPLPKTTTISRLLPNLESADFELSSDDVAALDAKDEYLTTSWDPTVYEKS
ncbi:hypothetical protein CANINC_004939 [Pichia inconspicua]|uniref:2-dehydropantolactone reductase n=1 Tax=Pichia inconspicua TaxID=52247 RepID=A0A4T0WUV1_9ASCO|nr:hypothetical protein CANINC_004939 [[Candida] inconspicua]